jgi:clan AA aspartic protease
MGERVGEIRVTVLLQSEADLSLLASGRLTAAQVRSEEAEAVVDTGAVMCLLPRESVERLGLRPLHKMLVTLADERKVEMERAGGLALTVAGRSMTTDCLVGPPGCEPLLGQLVLEELDLICDPARRALAPRHEGPDGPIIKMKPAAPFTGALREAARRGPVKGGCG